MKRIGKIWSQVVSWENLWLAYLNARKGKFARREVATFIENLESELIGLQRELVNGRYRPGPYRHFTVYERKPRLISAAPFRDRVVHHALMQIVEPLLDRRFYPHSYACRKDKGIHLAVDTYQRWAKVHNYALKMDISKYFASIDRVILLRELEIFIKDINVLKVFDLIINSWSDADEVLVARSSGIPIGNYTSQFLANLYLNRFDYFAKQKLKIPAYLRYVDDLLLLAPDKKPLLDCQEPIKHYLADRLGLQIHPGKIHLARTTEKVDVLGYQISRGKRWLRADNGYRFRRKFRKQISRKRRTSRERERCKASIQSWIGHATHGETLGLRCAIFGLR